MSGAGFRRAELDCIFTDIFPDAVKVGMVSSAEIIGVIAESLGSTPRNIVVDPVMVSTSGSPLLKPAALDALKTRIFPLADILTPNIHEAELLAASRWTPPRGWWTPRGR